MSPTDLNTSSQKPCDAIEIDERISRLSDTKRALLEQRLVTDSVKTDTVQGLLSNVPPSSFLVAVQPKGSRPPLFWIHGENSTVFLPRFLSPDQPLYGLYHQSRDGRRARYTSVEAMAARYLEEIRAVQPEGPYFLGGFCVGATVAFEIAWTLRKEGKKVGLVIVVDPPAPGAKDWYKGRSKPVLPSSNRNDPALRDRVERFFCKLAPLGSRAKARLICNTTVEKLNELPAAAARAGGEAAKKVAAYGGKMRIKVRTAIKFFKKLAGRIYCLTGAEHIPQFLVAYYLDVLYRRAARAYRGRSFDGRLIILATEDAIFDPWSYEKFCAGGLEVVEIDARHDEVMYWESQIQIVAEKVKSYLEKAQASLSAAA
jgi:thioesterase domain-containing protein